VSRFRLIHNKTVFFFYAIILHDLSLQSILRRVFLKICGWNCADQNEFCGAVEGAERKAKAL